MAAKFNLDNKQLELLRVRISDERGAALILVLIMMLLLTIIGATLLTSSITDLQIAGNYRNNEEAFYQADAAIEFAQTSGTIYTTIIPGVVDVYTGSLDLKNGKPPVEYKVQYIGSGAPPAGSGNDDTFQANFYVVEATGTSANNSKVETESEIARLVPKAKSY